MKRGLFAQILSLIVVTLSSTISSSQPSYAQSQNQKFFCGMSKGVPTTLVRTSRGTTIPVIRWVDTSFPPPWTPEQRCEEISTRFQQFYEKGTLNFLRASKFRGQPVLCVASYRGGDCLPNGVLVTLKPGSDPQQTLARLNDYRGRAGGEAILLDGRHSDSEIFVHNRDGAYLDIQKLMEEAETSNAGSSCKPGQPAWEC
jgi:Circadian oscillating protein COP23